MGYDFELNGERSQVHPVYTLDAVDITIDDAVIEAQLSPGESEGEYHLELNGETEKVFVATSGDTHFIHLRGRVHVVESINALERAKRDAAPDGGDEIMRAPMPGTVVDVNVQAGDAVQPGQVLLTIESMKLQTAITALHESEVAEVYVAAGETFDQGAALVRLESDASDED